MSFPRRFWFTFASLEHPTALALGCGVSATSYEEAISFMRSQIFKAEPLPEIASVIEDVDVSTLDRGHVIPNMESPLVPGIWFPKGYR